MVKVNPSLINQPSDNTPEIVGSVNGNLKVILVGENPNDGNFWTKVSNLATGSIALDHGALTGLSDDDHTQYHTAGRANAWFGMKALSEIGSLDAGGRAITNTGLINGADMANVPTDDEKAALVGSNGTPSAANPFVTDTDPRLIGSGGGLSSAYVAVTGDTGSATASAGDTLAVKSASAKITTIAVNNDPTDGDVVRIDAIEANFNLGNLGGALANDAQHGTRGGGNTHPAAVAGGANGFITGTDQNKLNTIALGAQVNWVQASPAEITAGTETALRSHSPADIVSYIAQHETGGSGGTPGGADTNVQFNDGGSFGGDAGFTYNKVSQFVSLAGGVLTDIINEQVADAGVTIDGLLLKDGLADGRNLSVDGIKLDGVEAGAEVNQTNLEIKTQYEANANTNEFSDAEKTKLSGIADGAQVNPTQATPAEITAGTEIAVRGHSPADIVSYIAQHETGGGGGAMPTYNNRAALIAATDQTGVVYMEGYVTTRDGGQGFFQPLESGALIDDGLVFAHGSGGNWRFERIRTEGEKIYVRWFGVPNDGSDVSSTVNAIIANHDRVVFTPGQYGFGATPMRPRTDSYIEAEGGRHQVTLVGLGSITAIIEPNATFDTVTDPRKRDMRISGFRFTGDCQYAVNCKNVTNSIFEDLRPAFFDNAGTARLINDCMYFGNCWSNTIRNVDVSIEDSATTATRGILRFDGECNDFDISSLKTSAICEYGIWIGYDNTSGTPDGTSKNIFVNGFAIQGPRVGIAALRCINTTLIGQYVEQVQQPIVMGDDVMASGRCTGLTVSGVDFSKHNPTRWGSNTTGVLNAVDSRACTFTGCSFLDSGGGQNIDVLYYKDCRGLLLQGVSKNNFALSDLRSGFVAAPGVDPLSNFRVTNNGNYGDEQLFGRGSAVTMRKYGDGIPATGTFVQGDIIDIQQPGPTDFVKHRCIVGGVDTAAQWQSIKEFAVENIVSAQSNNTLTDIPKFWTGTEANYQALTPTDQELYHRTA